LVSALQNGLGYGTVLNAPGLLDRPVARGRMAWWATHEAQRFNNDLAYATVPQEATLHSEDLIRHMSVNGVPVPLGG